MDDKSYRTKTQGNLTMIKGQARKIADRIVHLEENPEHVMSQNEDTEDVKQFIEGMSQELQKALENAEKYRQEEIDNPTCPECGSIMEVAVTSSNITGHLCPECDG